METVSTIGHSNRSIEEFIALLKQNGITCLLDIRTVPKSRHNPQFGQDQLPRSLQEAGIEYRYFAGLGGLRRPREDSPNGGNPRAKTKRRAACPSERQSCFSRRPSRSST